MLLNKVVFMVAILASTSALSQVYRCTGDDGQKVFSSLPCGPDAQQIAPEDLTPTSGGTLGVPRKHSDADTQSPFSHGSHNTFEPMNKQIIATRYQDLRNIVAWLVGSDQLALRDRYISEIRRNETRAMRAEGLHPDWQAINVGYDERLEQLQRQYLGDNVNLARAWISLEAERDAEMLLFPPEP